MKIAHKIQFSEHVREGDWDSIFRVWSQKKCLQISVLQWLSGLQLKVFPLSLNEVYLISVPQGGRIGVLNPCLGVGVPLRG